MRTPMAVARLSSSTVRCLPAAALVTGTLACAAWKSSSTCPQQRLSFSPYWRTTRCLCSPYKVAALRMVIPVHRLGVRFLIYLFNIEAGVGRGVRRPEGARHPGVGQLVPEKAPHFPAGLRPWRHQWLRWCGGPLQRQPPACRKAVTPPRQLACEDDNIMIPIPSQQAYWDIPFYNPSSLGRHAL